MATPAPTSTHWPDCDTDELDARNRMVAFTSFFGSVAIIGCLAAIAVIVAHRKAIRGAASSFRNRLIFGLLVGNLIYSVSNVIPTNAVGTTADGGQAGAYGCGAATVDGATYCTGRGLWLWGRFTLTSYELLIIVSSTISLRTGAKALSKPAEIASHVCCFAAGAAAMIAHMAICKADVTSADEALGLEDDDDWTSAQFYLAGPYAHTDNHLTNVVDNEQLVVAMRVWTVLFIAAFGSFLYHRYVLRSVMAAWNDGLQSAEEEWDRSLWDRTNDANEKARSTKKKLLDLQKAGITEVAKPLEKYVAVFVVFGVPAIIMATQTCDTGTGNCNVICEMVLSLRSLADVAVFFSDPQSRAQLLNFSSLLQRLKWRCADFCGSEDSKFGNVRFRNTIKISTKSRSLGRNRRSGFGPVQPRGLAQQPSTDSEGGPARVPHDSPYDEVPGDADDLRQALLAAPDDDPDGDGGGGGGVRFQSPYALMEGDGVEMEDENGGYLEVGVAGAGASGKGGRLRQVYKPAALVQPVDPDADAAAESASDADASGEGMSTHSFRARAMSQTHVAVGPDEDLYASTPYQDAAEIGEGSGYVDVAPN